MALLWFGVAIADEVPKYSVTALGEVVPEGSIYYSFGVNDCPNELYSIAVNISTEKWREDLPFQYPYNYMDCKEFMLGGRITRWVPKRNSNFRYGSSTGILKPYWVLEINRHSIENSFSFTKTKEILWQEDVYLGVEIFPSLKYNLCVVIEGGLENLSGAGIWATYNIGCRWYTDLEFLKKKLSKKEVRGK
ncbi:MAG: hypothetical protein V1649_00480 [Patescibacteria group bacterium]